MIISSLLNLTNKSASSVIHEAYQEMNISENNYVKLTFPDYSPFRNKKTQKKLLKKATNVDGSAMTVLNGQAAWDTLVKKPDKINPLFIKEILFRLEELVFGTDMIGCNAYQLLR